MVTKSQQNIHTPCCAKWDERRYAQQVVVVQQQQQQQLSELSSARDEEARARQDAAEATVAALQQAQAAAEAERDALATERDGERRRAAALEEGLQSLRATHEQEASQLAAVVGPAGVPSQQKFCGSPVLD